MRTEPGGGVPKSAAFAQALGTLKREGSNILLVGAGAESAHAAACQRLLGDTNAESHYKLLVVTEDTTCSCSRRPAPSDDARTRIISRTERGCDGANDAPESVVGTELLSVLGTEVIETVNGFEGDAEGLESSQLRVCVDSLTPLLSDHSPENVFRLLHVTTSRIRRASGMGHYHLPVDRNHDAVRLLEPLFDAVVEVRSRNGDDEQRWHLRDRRESSDWLSI